MNRGVASNRGSTSSQKASPSKVTVPVFTSG